MSQSICLSLSDLRWRRGRPDAHAASQEHRGEKRLQILDPPQTHQHTHPVVPSPGPDYQLPRADATKELSAVWMSPSLVKTVLYVLYLNRCKLTVVSWRQMRFYDMIISCQSVIIL